MHELCELLLVALILQQLWCIGQVGEGDMMGPQWGMGETQIGSESAARTVLRKVVGFFWGRSF